jgi:hypothetical protein
MPNPGTTTLEERYSRQMTRRAADARSRLISLLPGTPIGPDKRSTLAASYVDMALEYHRAITKLVQIECYGPACALVRLLFEAAVRGMWVMFCATSQEVVTICTRDDHKLFGNTEQLVKSVEDRIGPTANLLSFHNRLWKTLNSYTHSGLAQLGRRSYRGAKEQGYGERTIVEAVDHSTSILLLLFQLYFRKLGRVQQLWIAAIDDEYSRP